MTSVKRLIVLRHAKSAWDTGDIDVERPLNPRGLRDGVEAGRVLAELARDGDDGIGLVLCSTATRTRQTWDRAQVGGATADAVLYVEAIYGASPAELLNLARGIDPGVDTAVIIGHEPALSGLILGLAAPNDLTARVAAKFPTSAIAVLAFDGEWADLDRRGARLQRFEIPRG